VKAQTKKKTHWLTQIALDLSWPDAGLLDLTTQTPVAEAWEQVSRTCGLPPETIAEHVATHFDLPVAELGHIEAHVIKLLPEKLAKRYGVMPVREADKRLVVATADPTSMVAEDDIGFASGRTPQFEIAPPGAILDAQAELYSGVREPLALQLEDDLTRVVEVLEESGPEVVDASEVESAPIIKLTNFILSDAVKHRASDIHMEPGRGEGTVRIRVDGVMRPQLQLPMKAMNRVITRVKIMGKLDIADRLRPQDGRARIQIDAKPMELRISTVPTREAEKCVVRLLDHSTAPKLAVIASQNEAFSSCESTERAKPSGASPARPNAVATTTAPAATVATSGTGRTRWRATSLPPSAAASTNATTSAAYGSSAGCGV